MRFTNNMLMQTERIGESRLRQKKRIGENAGKYGIATCILDGDLASFWHSQWKGEGANPPLPHEIIIDMKSQQDILSIELARRQGNGDTKTVIFSIGESEEHWTELGQLTSLVKRRPMPKPCCCRNL